MPFHDFPADLYPDVLSRLPAKTLLKFKYVSKLWLRIIGDPKFSSMHANRLSDSSSTTQVCLRRFVDDDDDNGIVNKIYEIKWNGGVLAAPSVFRSLPDEYLNKRVRLVGSSNGVLCLLYQERLVYEERQDETSETDIVILWNPLSKHYHVLPPLPPYDFPSYYSYGFGYDNVNNDYKVVCFDSSISTHTTRAMIYSRKLNTWSTSPHKFPSSILVVYKSGLLYGGSLHFISIRDYLLVAFDLSNEEFKYFSQFSPEYMEFGIKYDESRNIVFDDVEKQSESHLRIEASNINDIFSREAFPYIQTLELY